MRKLNLFRKITHSAFFVIYLFLIPSEKATATTISARKNYSYDVIFSKNNILCKSISDFYNKHLDYKDDEKNGSIEDRFQKEFSQYGIDLISNKADGTGIFKEIKIYNNDQKKNIALLDQGFSEKFSTFSTTLMIFPDTENFDNAASVPPSSVELWTNFESGGGAYHSYKEVTQHSYVLKEYPNHEDLLEKFHSFTGWPPPFFPAINGKTAQRIISFENRIFVVARERITDSVEASKNHLTLIYDIDVDQRIEDVCYLQLR